MVALEPSGEPRASARPASRPASSPPERRLHLRMLILRQMTQHVAELVVAAALDGVTLAEHLLDRLPDDHEQPPPARVQAALDQILLGARWSPRRSHSLLPSRPARASFRLSPRLPQQARGASPIWIPSQVDHQEVPRIQPALHQLLQHALRLDRLTAHRRLAHPDRVGHLTDHTAAACSPPPSGPRASDPPRRPVSASPAYAGTSTSPPSPAPRRLSRGRSTRTFRSDVNHTTLPAIPHRVVFPEDRPDPSPDHTLRRSWLQHRSMG